MHHESQRIQPQRRQVQVQKENGGNAFKPCKSKTCIKRTLEAGCKKHRLIAIKPLGRKNRDTEWLFKCDCGKETKALKLNFLRGNTKSCGCLNIEKRRSIKTTHGMSKTPEFNVWLKVKARCFNQKLVTYPYYGGRGITMHQEWVDSFEAFYKYIGPRPSKKHSIDRINTDGHYEPGNVRWATQETQSNNKRSNCRLTFNQKTMTVSEWGKFLGIRPGTITQRLRYGWDIEKTLTQKIRKRI